MFNNYYYDEFIAMMDAYNDMHRIDKDTTQSEEVYADEMEHLAQVNTSNFYITVSLNLLTIVITYGNIWVR